MIDPRSTDAPWIDVDAPRDRYSWGILAYLVRELGSLALDHRARLGDDAAAEAARAAARDRAARARARAVPVFGHRIRPRPRQELGASASKP